MDGQRNYSRMLHSGNGAFYCAFVIVKLSGRFCVKPIYAHVSRFVRDPLLLHVPAYVMLPRIIPRNFLRLHTRRNKTKQKKKKETANNGARHCGTICVGAKCSFTLTLTEIFTQDRIDIRLSLQWISNLWNWQNAVPIKKITSIPAYKFINIYTQSIYVNKFPFRYRQFW